jgi:hypothetical protein
MSRHVKSNNSINLWVVFVFFLVCVNNCNAGHRVFKGKITDRTGEPVANAVVYIETYREGKGAFDFGYGLVDDTSQGTFSIAVKWKRNAIMAYAVFAPGMQTIAGFDRIHYYKTHDLLFEMDSIPHEKKDCESRLLGMSFPFERKASLAKRLRKPEYRRLLQAFIEVYKSIFDGTCPSLRGNEAKIRAVKDLQQMSGPL